MRRTLSLLLVLVLLLPGCGTKSKEDETTGQDAKTILRVVLAMIDEHEEANDLTWYLESADVNAYLSGFYNLEELNWSDGAIVRMEGARAFELAVLFVDEGDEDPTAEVLQQYLLDKKASFAGYFPDQEDIADRGLILTKRHCVALLVCQDPDQAKSAFETCFGGGVNARGLPNILPPDPEDYTPDGRLIYKDPGTDDMSLFDSSAILTAWESGEDSALSKEDKAVLDAARAVLEKCVTADMTDYNKELALYVWLTTHVDYDQSHYTKKGAPRTSYEPYGPLVKGTGVCLGYATTFQLLMDMAGVACITVTGAAFRNYENHAWNMVMLDGQWYCVDSTWDHINVDQDYPAEQLLPFYNYFNVTSDYMSDTDHQWDYDSVPEASAPDLGRP